jgi:glutaconyl-CoA/methylmalonyl-CoA decarboxylase subunit gamma
MDFMLALNVTIYGLGIVFLALLVLMVAIMLLGKIFAVVTGKDLLATPQVATPALPPPLLVAPASAAPAAVLLAPTPVSIVGEAAEPVNAPLPGRVLSVAVHVGDSVKRGDELCVIEAMKMGNSVKAPRDGFVVDVRVAQGNTVAFGAPLVFLASSVTAGAPRPAAPAVAPAASVAPVVEAAAFTLGAAGKTHAVELAPAGAGALTVLLDGTRYDVRRDAGDRTKLVVNGQAHTVDVKEIAGTVVTVMIDSVTHKLEMGQQPKTTPRAFRLTSGGKPHTVEVVGADGAASVVLDGTPYRVERDRAEPSRIVVNGQAHTVNVKETAGSTVTVVIDGRTEKVEIARDAVGAPAQAAGGLAAPAAAPAASGGEPINAPLPGKILSVAVKAGDRVKRGDELCVIEAMKMGNSVKVPRDGVIRAVRVAPGQTVAFGAALVVLD